MHYFNPIINLNLSHSYTAKARAPKILIASAVRTPIGSYKGNLNGISVQKLGAIAIEAALQRAGCSKNYVDAVYLGYTAKKEGITHQVAKMCGLSNNTSCFTYNLDCFSGIMSIIHAYESLMINKDVKTVVAGGVESMSNNNDLCEKNLLNDSLELEHPLLLHSSILTGIFRNQSNSFTMECNTRLRRALSSNIFDAEIEPIRFRNNGVFLNITKDDPCDRVEIKNYQEENNMIHSNLNTNQALYTDGSCALVLMTSEKAEEIDCKPLAMILGYSDVEVGSGNVSASCEAINDLLRRNKISKDQIALIQVNTLTEDIGEIIKIFDDTNKINIHGDIFSLGAFTGAQSVAHLIHILKENQLGFALISTKTRAMGILLKKLPNHLPPGKTLPMIKLYTKNPCPLCDELLNELELNFSGKYELVKCFIDSLENEQYLELYKYDIPVVFFNGQYLCKHRLDKDVLKQKLMELNL